MERIESINYERIAWCCADFNITPGELAAKIGVSTTSMQRLMAGEAGITFNSLRKIADYFGRGVLFFLEVGPVNEAMVHSAHFRTLANQKPELSIKLKKLIQRVEQQRAIYLSLREDLDELETLKFSPPKLPRTNPAIAAGLVRKWLGLAESNNFDSYRQAVEAKGVLVFRSNGYNGDWQIPKESPILGFTLYDTLCPIILIKKLPWETRQSFTLMHELAHLLLHKASSIDNEQDLHAHQGSERDANAFAGYLLIPEHFLEEIQDASRPAEIWQFDDWLDPQRKKWGVSVEVILRRLLETGRLPQTLYMEYRQWHDSLPIIENAGGTRQHRYREPLNIFGDEFVRTVLEAVDARQITLARASSYLDNLKIKAIHQLELYYASI